MSTKYVLDEHGDPQAEPDLIVWAKWFEVDERRIVRRNQFYVGDKEITVSTVFLGLDHNWSGGAPVLWETMVFGLDDDEQQWRYTNRDEAIANHEKLVADLLERDKDG